MAINKRYQAGTAWIKVAPDFRGWTKDLANQVEKSSEKLTARVELETSDARASLREFERQNAKILAEVGLDKSSLAKVRAELAGLHDHKRKVMIRTELDNTDVRRKLHEIGTEKAIQFATQADIKLNPKSVTKNFDRIQKDFAEKTSAGFKVDSKAMADSLESALKLDKTQNDIAKVRKELKALNKVEDEYEKKRQAYGRGDIKDWDEAVRLAETYQDHQKQIGAAQKRLNKYTRSQRELQKKLNKDLEVTRELSNLNGKGLDTAGADSEHRKMVQQMADRREAIADTEKRLARYTKKQKEFQDQLARYQRNEISFDDVEKLGDAWEKNEKRIAKARERLTQYNAAQILTQKRINDDLKQAEAMQARTAEADRNRRPTLQSSDGDKGRVIDRLRTGVGNTKVANSKLEEDIVALRNATQSARQLDSAVHTLETSHLNLSKAEREVIASEMEINNLRSKGNISSENAQRALERHTRALHAYTQTERQTIKASQAVALLRDNYNRFATKVQERINLNPIRRFGDTLDNNIARQFSKLGDRLLFTGRLISSIGSIGMASAVGLAALAAVNMAPAIGSLSQMVGVLGLIPGLAASAGAALAAISIGVSGIGGAFKAANKLSEAVGTGNNSGAGSRAARSAQRDLEKANKAAAKTAVQGARSIADAEKGIQRAQKASVDAQKNLTKARKEAQRQNEELKESIRDMAMEEEDAALSVEEARQRLGEVLRDPESTATERKRADLSYRQALEQQRDLRREHGKTKEEFADAQRKGVEGSDAVVDAQEQVKEAAEGVIEAQESLVQAQQDAADANAEAMERVTEAQENLAVALNGGAGNADAAAKAAEEYRKELDKLAPSARGFVEYIYGMKDSWDELRKSVQQKLFSGLVDDIEVLRVRGFNVLKGGLTDIAAGLNQGERHFLTYLSTARGMGNLDGILQNTASSAGSFSRALSNGLQALLSMSEVGTEFMPWFGRSLEDTTRKWRTMAENAQDTGTMEAYFARSISRAQTFGSILAGLGGVIKELFGATSTMGLNSLTHLDAKIKGWRDDLTSTEGQNSTREFFMTTRAMLSGVADMAGAVGTIIANDIVPALEVVHDILAPIIGLITTGSKFISEQTPIIRTLLSVYLGFRILKGTFGLLVAGLGKVGIQVSSQTGAVGLLTRAWQGATGALNGYMGRAALAAGLNTKMAAGAAATLATGKAAEGTAKKAGMLTTAATKSKAMWANLLGFVGGPAGAVIAGVAVSLMAWHDASNKVSEANKRLEETSNKAWKASLRLNDSIVKSRGERSPETLTAATEQVEALMQEWQVLEESASGFWSKFGGGVAEVFTLGKSNTLNDQLNIDQQAKAWRPYLKVLQDLKLNAEDVGLAISGTDDDWARFADKLKTAGTEGERAARYFGVMRGEIKYQEDAIKSIEPGYLDLQDALKTLADTASSTADKFDALQRAFRALIPGQEGRDNLKAFGKELADLDSQVDSIKPDGGYGSELLKNGDLDLNKANAGVLDDAIQRGRDLIGKMELEGQDTTEAWDLWTTKIRVLGQAAGIVGSDMDTLLEKLYATPDRVDSIVAVQGIDKAGRDLVALRAKFSDLKPGEEQTYEVKLEGGEESIEALERFGAEVKPLLNGNHEITMDFESFNNNMGATVAKIQAFSLIKAQATVDLNTNSLKLNADQANNILGILDKYQADPVAGLLIGMLQNKKGLALDELDRLGREETMPVVDANIDPLTTKIEEARKQITDLASPFGYVSRIYGKNPDGSDPTTEQVLKRIEDAKKEEEANRIPAGTPGVLTPGDFAAEEKKKKVPGNYRGGRLPAFAFGGRMPTSGPGSEKRDGFLAVGPDGKPVARVDGGEWIINSQASSQWDWLLSAINSGQLRGFATGGKLGGGMGMLQQVGSTISSAASGMIEPAIGAVTTAMSQLGTQFPQIAQNQVAPAWQNMATLLNTAKQTVLDPMFNGVQKHLTDMGVDFTAAAALVKPTWVNLTSQIMAAKTDTIDPAFAGIQGGLSTVQGAFGTAVPAIASLWNGMRAATADPVRFTINTVFNDGLVGMWNSVADMIGAKKMTPYVAKFAKGGVLPGYTPGRDVHRFVSPTAGELHLSGGEAIMRPEWVRAQGGPAAIEQMNRDARLGRAGTNEPGHYANGSSGLAIGYGVAPGSSISYGAAGFPGWVYKLAQSFGVQASTYPGHQEGNRNEAGYAPNPQGLNRGIDWSGPVPNMQRMAEYLLGIAPRTPALEQIIWQNPETGQRIGWAGRSPDISGAYFANDYAGHQDHVHTRQSGPLMPGMKGAAIVGMLGRAAMDMGSVIRGMFDPEYQAIKGKIAKAGFGGSMMGELPSKTFEAMYKSMSDKAIKLANESGLYGGPPIAPGGSVERWRPMVIAALRRNGFEPSRRNQDLMLAQIQSESGGNPGAVQGVVDVNSGGNEAVGLLQIAKGTWPGVRDPSLPDDRTDPWANMNAALRYYRGKYGDDLGTMWGKGHGYDQGGIFEHGTFGWNASGKPEAVFTNPEWKLLADLVEALKGAKKAGAFVQEPAVKGVAPQVAPEKLQWTPPAEDDAEGDAENASKIEYTPAKIDPETSLPYDVDTLSGVPLDPKTGKPFEVDPVTKKPITKGDNGLYIDPETGKPFYGSDAERLEVKRIQSEDTFTFENNADELGYKKDWIDEYNGPFSDPLKKGKLIGQLGQALSNPGAFQRIGNDKLMNSQIQTAKARQDEYELYKSDQAARINELRAEGKTEEAKALEAEARAKMDGMAEMPGTSPGTQAMLATMQENPGEQWRRESADQWKQWASENWAGVAESVVAAGAMGAHNSGVGQIAGTVNINTTDLSGAFREMDRRSKRASRANSRVVRR
ncbi:tape measure protein [Gordonia phage BrutonGaster]|uniref:Tape measure protein n=1 Tax=Gordonia phage BrutonGaster TaxID=2530116 RepID=A0A482JHK3_9CAUD|nr:tail length tape measure protein [Gordonia phage BrutonGaster]QBP33251.1 tape measure protein [Gordonia phage BrutonGaster]